MNLEALRCIPLTLLLGLLSGCGATQPSEGEGDAPHDDGAPQAPLNGGAQDPVAPATAATDDPHVPDAGARDTQDEDLPPFTSVPATECAGSLTGGASQMLTTYCAECHGGGAQDPEPRLFDFTGRTSDLRALVLKGWVVPDEAENSPLYQSVAERAMPPRDSQQPSAQDVAELRAWIDCGAEVWD